MKLRKLKPGEIILAIAAALATLAIGTALILGVNTLVKKRNAPAEQAVTSNQKTSQTLVVPVSEPSSDLMDGDELASQEEYINNGSYAVKYNGAYYRREYEVKDFEEVGLAGDFAYADTDKSIIAFYSRVSFAGEFPDKGFGPMYFYQERLYSQYYGDPETKEPHIYSCDMNGLDFVDLGPGEFVGINEKAGALFRKYTDEEFNPTLSVYYVGGEERVLTNRLSDTYCLSDGLFYYSVKGEEDASELSLMNFDAFGEEPQCLATLRYEDYPQLPYESEYYTIENVYAHQDHYIYFQYGGYSGTGHFYDGGIICKVRFNGAGFQVLTQDQVCGNGFFLFDNYSNQVIYTTNEEMEPEAIVIFGEDILTEKPQGTPGEVFFDWDTKELVTYACEDGKRQVLVNKEELFRDGMEIYDIDIYDDYCFDVREIERVDGWLYYSTFGGTHETAEDIGWRYAYRLRDYRRYRKNLLNGEIELLTLPTE